MTDAPTFAVKGVPLADIGLDDALIIYGDGTYDRLTGFVQFQGETIVGSLLSALPEDACILFDVNRSIYHNELRLH